MTYRYFYKGTETVHIPYLGTFEPNKEYEVSEPINHPDFEEVKKDQKKEK